METTPTPSSNRRGSVLINVLITGVLCSILAAGLMSVVLLEYQIVDRAHFSNKGKRMDEQALALMLQQWNEGGGAGAVCSSMSQVGYTCTPAGTCGAGGTCQCTHPTLATITGVTCSGRCKICICSVNDASCTCTCP